MTIQTGHALSEPIVKSYVLTYSGSVPSANEIYAGKHWAVRASLKKKFEAIFHQLFQDAEIESFDKFSLLVKFNTRHDTDNLFTLSKMMVDSLVSAGLVPNDNTKHLLSTSTLFATELPKGSVQFHILILK